MQNSKRGFTLVEMLVVIAIIGVLSTIVMSSLGGARARGRDARRLSDIKQIQLALEIYYDSSLQLGPDHEYPAVLMDLQTGGFIPKVPTDPRTNGAYPYVPLQGASSDNTVCASYHLGAVMEIAPSNPPAAGSPFNDDDDVNGGTNGTYSATVNGPQCSSGSLPTIDGTNDSTNKIYDVRP